MVIRNKRRGVKRVGSDRVRRNAKEGFGGSRWLRLPAGVEEWKPEKAGRYAIDIYPYQVSCDNHPDGIEADTLWYKRMFRIHFHDGNSYVCPKTLNKDAPCPWCRTYLKMRKRNKDEEALRPFQGQVFEIFNIRDPADKTKVAVMAMSYGKFSKALKEELEAGEESDLLFFDVNEDGRTLKVRFNEKKFRGAKFLQAGKIDFVPRKPLNQDKILRKVVNLDKCFNIMPYEKLLKAFKQVDADEEVPRTKKVHKGGKSKKVSGKKKPIKRLKHKAKHKAPRKVLRGKVKPKKRLKHRASSEEE